MRKAHIERKTAETEITIDINNLDGNGQYSIQTGIAFFDHMLSHIAKHGLIDMTIKAKGDTDIDFHHTVEDVGICFGQAVKQAIGDKKGINRYGEATIPLNEALSSSVVDLCNRTYLVFNADMLSGKTGDFDTELVEEFFHGFADGASATVHINTEYGKNLHHVAETIFKSFGVALSKAVAINSRIKDVRSTKEML